MKETLNFFDRLMLAVTFAEAGVDAAECTPAGKSAAANAKKTAPGQRLAHATKARG